MYIDPNTGGMLFQILASLFVVVSAVLLVFSSRIKMFLARLRRRRAEPAEPAGLADEDEPGQTGE
jgi:hypothetical protein